MISGCIPKPESRRPWPRPLAETGAVAETVGRVERRRPRLPVPRASRPPLVDHGRDLPVTTEVFPKARRAVPQQPQAATRDPKPESVAVDRGRDRWPGPGFPITTKATRKARRAVPQQPQAASRDPNPESRIRDRWPRPRPWPLTVAESVAVDRGAQADRGCYKVVILHNLESILFCNTLNLHNIRRCGCKPALKLTSKQHPLNPLHPPAPKCSQVIWGSWFLLTEIVQSRILCL